ncbi:oligosaccharide flippase family protein [candidate division KSB1 bacterium]|nr:oligosaccharide flippase family protein [candidate division KSB1 bacterium]
MKADQIMIADLKNILKHGSIYSLGNILSKLIGFVMIPVYTSYLTPADYGILELLTLVSSVLATVLALRISSGLARYYFIYKSAEEKQQLVSTSLNFVAILSLIAGILLSSQSNFFSRLVFSRTDYTFYFILIFISLAFELATAIGYAYVRILEKSIIFITISIMQLLLGLGFNIYFIVVLQWGVSGILYSMILSNGVACIVLSLYTYARVKFHFNLQMLKKLFFFSLPLVPAGILIFTLNMGDRFIMNRLLSLGDVGIYALGYKFGMLLSTFIGAPFASIWAPKRVEIYEDRLNRDDIFPRVFKYFTLVLVVTGLIISVLIQDIVKIVAAPDFWSAYRVVPLVILGYTFYNMYNFVDIGFYVHNKTYYYVIINAIAALANIGLNFLLIPIWGVMGAAAVTAISFAICPLLAYVISQRYYRLKYDLVALLKLFTLSLLVYFATTAVNIDSLFASIAVKSLILLTLPLLLYIVGYFDGKELSYASHFLSKYLSVNRS